MLVSPPRAWSASADTRFQFEGYAFGDPPPTAAAGPNAPLPSCETRANAVCAPVIRPSSLTLLTVAGLNVGTLIGGAVVVEVIFSLPGIGTLLFQAITARQYVALQSLVAIVAIGYVLVNFFVDILYAVLDPRIRHARA